MTTGERIKAIRTEKGLTQKELGAALGLTYQTIAQWETGKRNPKLATLQKIASALNVPLDDLLGEGQEKVMVELVEPDTEKIRDEVGDLRFSLGRTGLIKARTYMKDLMYNPENLPWPQKGE